MRSFFRLQQVDPGFNAGAFLMRFFMPRASYPTPRVVQLYQEMVERVKALPGIETAAAVSTFPFSGTAANVVFTIPSRPTPGTTLQSNFGAATPGYFRALGIGLGRRPRLRGRRQCERAVVVVNQAMATQFFPGQDPIGQNL